MSVPGGRTEAAWSDCDGDVDEHSLLCNKHNIIIRKILRE